MSDSDITNTFGEQTIESQFTTSATLDIKSSMNY